MWRGLWLWVPAFARTTGGLLARPQNARDPQHVFRGDGAVGMLRIERFQLDGFRRGALELLGHHLAVPGLDHDTVAAANRGCRRHQDYVAVAIGWLHRLAGHFQRIGV